MNDPTWLIVAVSVVALAIIGVQIWQWYARRKWLAKEPGAFLVDEMEFDRVTDRVLVDTRIVRYEGTHRSAPVLVEVGSGPAAQYARIDFVYANEVPFGLRISSEYEEGFLTRVMRMREIEIGIEEFDSQFILLCRDEERLRALLDPKVRELLLSLRDVAHDVRLNDEGLHLQLSSKTSEETFASVLDDGARLAARAYRRILTILENEATEGEDVFGSQAFTPIPEAKNEPEVEGSSQ